MKRQATAAGKVGANGISMRNTFEGRWVNTIVRSRPNRSARRGAMRKDAVWMSATPKKTKPTVADEASYFAESQCARNACTTNPPPNESSANNPDRRHTVRRDLVRPERLSPADRRGASTSAESDAATAAPASAVAANTRNQAASRG